jgi:hypothetical protein
VPPQCFCAITPHRRQTVRQAAAGRLAVFLLHACLPYTRPGPPLRITALRTATAPAGQPYNVCIADAALPYAYCNSCEAACFACYVVLRARHSLQFPALLASCACT